MGSSGGHRKLPGGSDHFSWHTDKHCIIIYISSSWALSASLSKSLNMSPQSSTSSLLSCSLSSLLLKGGHQHQHDHYHRRQCQVRFNRSITFLLFASIKASGSLIISIIQVKVRTSLAGALSWSCILIELASTISSGNRSSIQYGLKRTLKVWWEGF